MQFWIDPNLAEEAVSERLRARAPSGDTEARQWQREREAVASGYEAAAPATALAELAGAWFERLDLARPLHAALAFTPHVRAAVTEVRLQRAACPAQEGLVLHQDANGARLVLALTPARFRDSSTLREFCLRECLYAEQTLDPSTGTSSDLDPARADEGARAELARARRRTRREARIARRVATLLGMARRCADDATGARCGAGRGCHESRR